MKKLILFGAIVVAAALAQPPDAAAQSLLSPHVVAPGSRSHAGSVYMFAVVGQPVIGVASAPPQEGRFGFAYPIAGNIIDKPTAVRVFGMLEAQIDDRTMVIAWDMPDANGVDGFNVYRRVGDAELQRLNAEPVAVGKVMAFVDEDIRPGRRYEYIIGTVEPGGEFLSHTVEASVPAWKTELEQNYPNPFNPATTIPFYLADNGDVSLRIYNVRGQLVRELVNQPLGFGAHELNWDGTSDRGTPVASGVYFYRLITRGESFTKRMMILK